MAGGILKVARLILLTLCLASAACAEDRDAPYLALVPDRMPDSPFDVQMVLATLRRVYRETITHEEITLRLIDDFDWMRLGQDI